MFKAEYQGGSHVEVLSAQGRDPMAHCKLTGNVSRRYDKSIRGYVQVMEGDSTSTRMQLPGNERTSLGLVQPFLVLQVFVPKEARFTVELNLQDAKGGRRRLLLSSSVKEPSISPLIARVPLVSMTTGQWVNLCLELPSLISELFPGHTHKSLESLVVGGACQLRRVFTLRDRPSGSQDGSLISGGGDIPKACQMTVDHTPIPTQVMSSVTNSNQPQGAAKSATATGSKPPTASSTRQQQRLTHVAFGKKVAIPEHILSRQQTSRSANNLRRKAKPSADVPTSSRQSSAPSSVRGDVATLEGVGGGGRDQQTQDGRGARGEGEHRGRARDGEVKGEGHRGKEKNKDAARGHSSGRGEDRREVTGERRRVTSDSLGKDELLALDVLGVQQLRPRVKGHVRGQRYSGSSGVREDLDTVSDSVPYRVEPRGNTSNLEFGEGLELGHGSGEDSYLDYSREEGEEEEEEEEEESEEREGEVGESGAVGEKGEDKLFSYFSPPRSAGSTHTPSAGSKRATRGVELDQDFLQYSTTNEQAHPHSSEESEDEEGFPHDGTEREPSPHDVIDGDQDDPSLEDSNAADGQGLPHDVTGGRETPLAAGRDELERALNETRLSDDYDWRQYASGDERLLQSDVSLRTRLAQGQPSHTHTLTGPHGNSTSSDMDSSTLSESMTLGGWAETVTGKTAANSLLDSLDTRNMGGAFSPAATLSDQPPVPLDSLLNQSSQSNQSDEELELMYDPQLKCFYDPKTHKYYELMQ